MLFSSCHFLICITFCRGYLDKTISLHLNKGRKVTGTLRGYDQFMNIVLGDAMEDAKGGPSKNIGMVVRLKTSHTKQVHYIYFPDLFILPLLFIIDD